MDHTFTVQAMTCAHCEKAVTNAIHALDPEAKVRIDRSLNKVEINSERARALLAQTIANEGYTVSA